MAITHSTTGRNTMADAVLALVDGGNLEFQTSGSVEVATLALSATAFGAASSGTATANSISPDTSATGGTIAKFELQTSGGTGVVFGSVTAVGGGGDIEITSLSIGAGDTVSVTSLDYTAPA